MKKEQRVVMITGASKGLGRELALSFARVGASIAICSRNKKGLLQVKSEVEALGATVLATQADVSHPENMERFSALVHHQFGHVDVLINNASILGPSPMPLLIDYPEADFEEVIKVNTLSPFLLARRVLPMMLQRNKGKIFNVTSEAGNVGYAGWGAYGVSKFALEGLTQTWADELKETNIRINMIDPGEMATEMHEKAVPDCDYDLNDPVHVANVIRFLASETNDHLHGQRLCVDDYLDEGAIL